jgi:hypothetical protein
MTRSALIDMAVREAMEGPIYHLGKGCLMPWLECHACQIVLWSRACQSWPRLLSSHPIDREDTQT